MGNLKNNLKWILVIILLIIALSIQTIAHRIDKHRFGIIRHKQGYSEGQQHVITMGNISTNKKIMENIEEINQNLRRLYNDK